MSSLINEEQMRKNASKIPQKVITVLMVNILPAKAAVILNKY